MGTGFLPGCGMERKAAGRSAERRGRYKAEQNDMVPGPYPIGGSCRDIVSSMIGMSGKQYERAKYITDNAPQDVIDELDRGECGIRTTYDELRANEKANKAPVSDIPKQNISKLENKQPKKSKNTQQRQRKDMMEKLSNVNMSKHDKEAIVKIAEFAAMSPEDKIVELSNQLKEQRTRAVNAEADLDRLQAQYTKLKISSDSTIVNLKMQIESLDKELEAANERIKKLEGVVNGSSAG